MKRVGEREEREGERERKSEGYRAETGKACQACFKTTIIDFTETLNHFHVALKLTLIWRVMNSLAPFT